MYVWCTKIRRARSPCIRAIFSWTRTVADRNSERKHQSADTMSVTLQVRDACNIRDGRERPWLPRSRAQLSCTPSRPARLHRAQGVLISQSAKCLFLPTAAESRRHDTSRESSTSVFPPATRASFFTEDRTGRAASTIHDYGPPPPSTRPPPVGRRSFHNSFSCPLPTPLRTNDFGGVILFYGIIYLLSHTHTHAQINIYKYSSFNIV